MLFTHRDDPSRTATLTQKGDEPAFLVEHTDVKGKARKKTFKKGTVWQAQDAAIRFVLNKEGYVLRAPQDGPIAWMARLMLDGYRGEIGHTVDPNTGVVWVHDAEDQVHRIEPGTCATRTVKLHSSGQSPGASVAVGAGGTLCLAPSWNRTPHGLVRHLKLYRVTDEDGLSAELMVDLAGADLVNALSASRDGRVLGPAAGGVGLYGAQGLERSFACTPGEGQPVAAISASGEWVVTSHVTHFLRTHVASGEETRLRADEFKGYNSVQISDDGTVYASGFRYPSHGLWRLHESAEPMRVSDDIRATVHPDGSRVVSVHFRSVTVSDLTRPSDDEMKLLSELSDLHLPQLGMAKYGRAVFGPGDRLVVLTDAYTVAEISC